MYLCELILQQCIKIRINTDADKVKKLLKELIIMLIQSKVGDFICGSKITIADICIASLYQ